MKYIGLLFGLFLCAIGTQAQTRERCLITQKYTNAPNTEHLPGGRSFEQWMQDTRAQKRGTSVDTTLLTFTVVVHVVHNGETIGSGANIADSVVHRQIRVLNEDYRRRRNSPGFNTHPVGADSHIEFRLADRDPNGNPSNGIVRVNGNRSIWSSSANAERTLKALSFWDTGRFLNIWVCNMGTLSLGYATFPQCSGTPGLSDPLDSLLDGVVISTPAFGYTNDPDYDKGRTATHEIGHYLGLIHIWGDGPACAADDYCADTPLQAGLFYGCPTTGYQCSSQPAPQVENYLNYSDDRCMNLFTADQVARMRSVILSCPQRSRVVSLASAVSRSESLLAELFPNPTSDQTTVRFMRPGAVQLSLHNLSGQTLLSHSLSAQDVESPYLLSLENLPSGLYLVHLRQGNYTQSLKLRKD